MKALSGLWLCAASLAVLALAACDVDTVGTGTTGGVTDEDAAADGGSTEDGATSSDAAGSEAGPDGGDAAPNPGPSVCGRGVVAVLSDYKSTQIALLDQEGRVKSANFLSSASEQASGVATALGGDVVIPSSFQASREVVVLDRFGHNVLTWADPATAKVRAQLSVATGFESNPQDYLEIDEHKAYVTRRETNGSPGQMDHDGGGDVLIVDPKAPAIVGRIALPEVDGVPATPGGMLRLRDTVIVSLDRQRPDYSFSDSMLVGIKTSSDAVAWQLTLSGVKNCGRAAVSPNGKRLAVACWGTIDMTGKVHDRAESGVVLFDATTDPPKESRRFELREEVPSGVQQTAVFAGDNALLLESQSELKSADRNQLLSLDPDTGAVKVVASAREAGGGLVFGGVYCSRGCGDYCLLADAESGTVRRFRIGEDFAEEEATSVAGVGLSPRLVGAY